jgi:Zn-dependent membrane protease YugP
MYFGDMSYLIYVLPPLLLAMFAQSRVKSTYAKYSKLNNRNGWTGAEVARQILDRYGVTDVTIEPIAGELTDHYDPVQRVLRLSKGVYGSKSLAAVGIAAHECGHALQDYEDYFFLKLRHTIVPVVNLANKSAMPLAFLGLMLGYFSGVGGGIGYMILQLAILMFTAVVVFHLVTLPVELNASSRAIEVLEGEGILDREEIIPAKKVLNAAALTYIAAAAVAAGNLIRFIMLSRGRRR